MVTGVFVVVYLFCLQSGFIFSLIWSLGATCDTDSRDKFDFFLRNLLSGGLEDHATPQLVGKIEIPLPNEGSVYDVMFDMHGRGRWVPWLELIQNEKVETKNKKLSELIIPTIDTARYVSICYYVINLSSVHNRCLTLVYF